jgi:hypothetical protein
MRRIALALGAIAATFALLGGEATAAPGAQLSPAAQSLAQCVQTNGRLSVLMLIDESGSLVTTDPFNQRVDGIRAALTGLADLSETTVDGRRPQVSVLMAGFYGLVHPDPAEGVPSEAWRPVTHADVDELFDDAGRYAGLNHGRATDYATALTAARKLLAARAAEQTENGEAPPCRALIWFTDGRYSLPRRVGKSGVGLPLTVPYAPRVRLDRPGAGEEAVAAGKDFMCRPNGLMDGLQGDGVIRFTVALSTELSPADAAFLDAATTGGGGGQRCGAHLSQRSGEYLTASDGDRLFFAFANLLSSSPPPRVRSICPRLSCVQGVTTFSTVPGLSRFLIRAAGATAGSRAGALAPLQLLLEGPDGSSVTLRPGGPTDMTLAGTALTQRWVSPRAVEVEGDFSATSEAWLGRWSYSFVDPSASSGDPRETGYSTVQLFADLEPALKGSAVLYRGVPTTLSFDLVQGSDSNAPVNDGPLIREAHLTATIDDPVSGASIPVPVRGPRPDGSFQARVLVPRSSTAGFVYVGLTAELSTPGGTPIVPQYRSFNVPVRFPPGQGFPTVSPATLDLPSIEGLGEAAGVLTVRGSSVGPGCVWLGAPRIEAPTAAGHIDAEISPRPGSASNCTPIGKGEVRQFTVRLRPSAEAGGSVTGSLPVHLRSEIVDGDHVVSVPISFAMTTAPNQAARVALSIVLVILGALLPLLLLHGLNLAGARFPAPSRLRAVVLSVELARDGRLRYDSDGEAISDPSRGMSLSHLGSRRVRELEVGGLELEAVASGKLRDRAFELFRGPYGVATAGGRALFAVGRQPLRAWRGGACHEVPLGLTRTWIFRLDAIRPPEPKKPVEAGDRAAGWSPGEAPPAGDDFFASASSATEEVHADGDGAARPDGEAIIEGELVILISDGPPPDQGGGLLAGG